MSGEEQQKRLESLGWGEPFASAFAEAKAGRFPARVAVEHRNRYLLLGPDGELEAKLTGRMRLQLERTGERPVPGDWVVVHRRQDAVVIEETLPRRTRFSRKVAGRTTEEQVMAANIDTIFLATALNGDLNPRRLERYLLLTWESGANPVVLLTKADLASEIEPAVEIVRSVAFSVPVHVISSRQQRGLEELQQYLVPGQTVAVLGSSGVGKSTLINALLGVEKLRTGEVREDGRGRHTTTYRELVQLPSGALIIDTPGLRELQLWDGGESIQDAFTDIAELAQQCRFGDCAHESEPGCAVRAAVERGELPADRLESFHRLQRELAHIEEKTDIRLRAERARNERAADRLLQQRLKDKKR